MTQQANLSEPLSKTSGPAGTQLSRSVFPWDSIPTEKSLLLKLIERDFSIKTISDLCNLTDLTITEILEKTGMEKDELFKILLQKQGVWWEMTKEETLLRVLGEVM